MNELVSLCDKGERIPFDDQAARTAQRFWDEIGTLLEGEMGLVYRPFVPRVGVEYSGTVTGGSDWCDFFVRPDTYDEAFVEFMNKSMRSIYENKDIPSLKQLGLWEKGLPCAVKYTKDKMWYRAIVEDPDYNMIRFVDYGNVQMCSSDDIKPLSRQWVDFIHPTCIRCSLTKYQDLNLPSFVNDTAKVVVTILNTTEPYEVTIRIIKQDKPAVIEIAPELLPTRLLNQARRNDYRPIRAQRETTSDGLTLQNERSKIGFTADEDDLQKPKPAAAVAPSNTATGRNYYYRNGAAAMGPHKLSAQNADGAFVDLFATCGYVRLPRLPARRFEVNPQQSTFCRGPLMVEDMRRVFREGERVIFNGKYEESFRPLEWDFVLREASEAEGEDVKKGGKQIQDSTARLLVVDFRPHPHPMLLISHGVVSFVGDSACSLYVRNTGDLVWAPKATFPPKIAGSCRSLRDLIQPGRSVIFRAEPADKLADLCVDAEWIAKAVELVGETFEEKGTMYLVREKYSVIITEGNVGFGYVYVANQFVESAGVPQNNWYGTRVYFRSCLDVPDCERESPSYGFRMKALYAQLSPAEPKGQYYYAGIYRPVPYDDESRSYEKRRSKKLMDSDYMDLPEETLREFGLLGLDSIGIDAPKKTNVMEPAQLVAENLLNEMREKQVTVSDTIQPDIASSGPPDLVTDEPTVLIEMIEPNVPDSLLPPPLVPSVPNGETWIGTGARPKTFNPYSGGKSQLKPETKDTEKVPVSSVSSVSCQTDDVDLIDYLSLYEPERLQMIAKLEAKALYSSERDAAWMLKFLTTLDEDQRNRFFKLLS